MSLPQMQYMVVIEDFKTATNRGATESVFDPIKEITQFELFQYSQEVVSRLAAREKLTEPPVRFVTSGTHTCRESLTGSVSQYIEPYSKLMETLRTDSDSSGRTQYLYKMTIGVKVQKSGVPKYIAEFAKMYAGMNDGSCKIIVNPTNVIVEMSVHEYLSARMSMVLFIINRSEFFTREILEDKKLLIKKVISIPHEMFPNNVDSSPDYVVFQCFALSGRFIINANDVNLSSGGVVNYAKAYARSNPIIFAKFLKDYKIDFSNLERKFSFFYQAAGRNISWNEIIKIAERLFPTESGIKIPIKLNISDWNTVDLDSAVGIADA